MDISSLRERRTENVYTVSELNNHIKNIIENDRTLAAVTVRGEISNFVHHTSGHFYFTLKDEAGQIRVVMFRSSASRLKFMPENGMKVTAHGSVSVYAQSGAYQLYVSTLSPDGVGALYLMYEQLKERLGAEGLFSEEHKKPVPRFPRAVGVITSPTGAAVRDIINVTGRRYPQARIYLYPSLVQGEGAESELIRALDYFELSRLVDVIIIGRGGGSIEDLWAFNGEALARRIFSHSVPIISAVGHETDFTICDFVADMRAPTPSAAAEIAVPDTRELLLYTDQLGERAVAALKKKAEISRERLEYLKERRVLTDAATIFDPKAERVMRASSELLSNMDLKLKDLYTEMRLKSERLEALSPLAVLSRGYSVAESRSRTVRSVRDLSLGEEISVRFSDGKIKATVTKREAFGKKDGSNKNGN